MSEQVAASNPESLPPARTKAAAMPRTSASDVPRSLSRASKSPQLSAMSPKLSMLTRISSVPFGAASA